MRRQRVAVRTRRGVGPSERLGRGEHHRHLLQAADEVRRPQAASPSSSASRRSGSRCSTRVVMIDKLQPGQLIAQAEVRAEAERQVAVRVSVDVEVLRVARTPSRRSSPTRTAASSSRPRCSAVPWNSVSAVIVRAMFFTGDVQRSISSIAPGSRSESFRAGPTGRGCAVSCSVPPDSRVAGGLVAADQDQQHLLHDLVVGQPFDRRPRRAPGR